MYLRGVWTKLRRSDIQDRRWCVRNKRVFKVKRHGIFRARLVACGYSQLPGLDFNGSFAPVVNDVSFRILLIAMIVWNLEAKITNVEMDFLHWYLKEEVFMDIPPGMDADEDECLTLKKTICGLVQSSRQFYVKLVEALKSLGFIGWQVDLSLWI